MEREHRAHVLSGTVIIGSGAKLEMPMLAFAVVLAEFGRLENQLVFYVGRGLPTGSARLLLAIRLDGFR